jgi:hypothetical protein
MNDNTLMDHVFTDRVLERTALYVRIAVCLNWSIIFIAKAAGIIRLLRTNQVTDNIFH